MGDRCGECRVGLGVHNTADPLCGARKYPKHRKDCVVDSPSLAGWPFYFWPFMHREG